MDNNDDEDDDDWANDDREKLATTILHHIYNSTNPIPGTPSKKSDKIFAFDGLVHPEF
jgi:hypothetical protein